MKYKIGDEVRIRKGLENGKEYGEITCLGPHVEVSGKRAIIEDVTDSGNYITNISYLIFSQEMFEDDNKIKIIDILNMIANGEQPPKKIKYFGDIYEYKDCDYYDEDSEYLSSRICFDEDLNDEVEIIEKQEMLNNEVKIIEDKKIEKFTEYELKHSMVNEYILGIKINELIDKINEMEGEK